MWSCQPHARQKYAQYYDSPDGCEIDKKAMVAARYGLLTGVGIGTFDVLMYSHAHGFANILKRYALHAVPLSLMGATFALVSNGLLRVREKDDKLNYFLGGFATSPIFAAYVRNPHVIIPFGVIFGISGYVKKMVLENDWCFFPDTQRHYCPVDHWRHDYTLVSDPRDAMYHSCDDPDSGPGY